MRQYLELIDDVLSNGSRKGDRTGTGTLSVFGRQMRFSLSQGFPLLTTKKLHYPSIIHELIWFISGNTNIEYLKANGVSIWDAWADENGDLGPVYGQQWRSWSDGNDRKIDQLLNVIDLIKSDPNSRRLLVNAWNPGEVETMALPPCHFVYQFYVADNRLSCHFNMRSVDVFLGLPFNIASYALLTHLVAQQTGLQVGELIWSGGDVHLYSNHIEQAKEQLKRMPTDLPKLIIKSSPASISDYLFKDIEIQDYQPLPHIAAKVAV